MNSFSEFHFQGNVASMKLRVTLRGGSRLAGLPSFVEFSSDLHRQETIQDSQANRTVDEIQFTWGQHIDAKPNTGLVPPRAGEQGRNRTEPRLFTLVSGEQWPPHLEPYRSNLDMENETKPVETKTLPRPAVRRISPLQIWHRENPIIDLPPKSSKRSLKKKQAMMLIVANCASIHGSEKSPLDDVVICRISCENRTLSFSPPLTKSGYKLENRHGSLTAFLSILDEEFTAIPDDAIINESDYISEDSFDLPRARQIFYSYYVELVEALNFPHDPLFVEYRVEFPSYFIPVIDQSQMGQNGETETISGRTRTFYAKKSGKDQVTVLNHLFEIAFAIDPTIASRMKNEKLSWPILVFRVCSQDFWGRCFISGYGSVQLPMLGFKQEFEANCWRLKASESQRFAPLRDLLIGDIHELKDYLENKALNGSSRAGLSTTSSGTLRLRCSRLIQSRNFVSTEMMNRLKYGSMLDKIGINSSLHWRIMKVLMEFEEARRELLRIRARNKPQ